MRTHRSVCALFSATLILGCAVAIPTIKRTQAQQQQPVKFNTDVVASFFIPENNTAMIATSTDGNINPVFSFAMPAKPKFAFISSSGVGQLFGFDETVVVNPTSANTYTFQLPFVPTCAFGMPNSAQLVGLLSDDGVFHIANFSNPSNVTSAVVAKTNATDTDVSCSFLSAASSLYIYSNSQQAATTVKLNPTDPFSPPLVYSIPLLCGGVVGISAFMTDALTFVHMANIGPYNMLTVATGNISPSQGGCGNMIGIGPDEGSFRATASDGTNVAVVTDEALYVVDLSINDVLHMPFGPTPPGDCVAVSY